MVGVIDVLYPISLNRQLIIGIILSLLSIT